MTPASVKSAALMELMTLNMSIALTMATAIQNTSKLKAKPLSGTEPGGGRKAYLTRMLQQRDCRNFSRKQGENCEVPLLPEFRAEWRI